MPVLVEFDAVTTRLVDVAPVMSVKVVVPVGFCCQITVAPEVEEAAVKVAVPPLMTVWLVGLVVITGAAWTMVTARIAMAAIRWRARFMGAEGSRVYEGVQRRLGMCIGLGQGASRWKFIIAALSW